MLNGYPKAITYINLMTWLQAKVSQAYKHFLYITVQYVPLSIYLCNYL